MRHCDRTDRRYHESESMRARSPPLLDGLLQAANMIRGSMLNMAGNQFGDHVVAIGWQLAPRGRLLQQGN